MGGGGLLVGGLRKQNLDFAILKFGGFVGFVLIAHRTTIAPPPQPRLVLPFDL